MKELWKKIPGFEYYEASNIGRIRSLDRFIPHNLWDTNSLRKGKILNQRMRTDYLAVSLIVDNKTTSFSIHRLIAIAWIENIGNKKTVNHKNGIKTDNRVENLEWNTYSENTIHAFKNGLRKPLNGLQLKTSKLTINNVKKIKSLKGKMTHSKIAESFGVHRITIWDIMNNKTWKYV